MKIELIDNKVYFNNGFEKKEIHPFWLRERVNGEEFLDKGTQQRLFDPTFLNSDISIKELLSNEKNSVLLFKRYEVGEGIEKKSENFADEVMSQVNKT